jgi:hypothetical protein
MHQTDKILYEKLIKNETRRLITASLLLLLLVCASAQCYNPEDRHRHLYRRDSVVSAIFVFTRARHCPSLQTYGLISKCKSSQQRSCQGLVRFEVLTALKVTMLIWVVTPCGHQRKDLFL